MKLTPGQAAVRRHVKALVRKAPERGTPSVSLIDELVGRLAEDTLVAQDAVTGKRIDRSQWSPRYLHLLATRRRRKVRPFARLPIEGFVYTRGDELRVGAPAFELGVKRHTTAEALFALARGNSPPTRSLDAYVYMDHELVTPGSGGNHRLLAMMLWGWGFVDPKLDVEWVSAPRTADEDTNDAMSWLEQLGCLLGIERAESLERGRALFLTTNTQDRAWLAGEAARIDLRSERDPLKWLELRMRGRQTHAPRREASPLR